MAEVDNKIPHESNPPPGPLEYGEYTGFALDSWKMRHARWRSWRDLSLSYVLFAFVLIINICWETCVIKWIKLSGTKDAAFHLSDNVLIALATTSVANFIGLVAIVAKHLFPEIKEEQQSSK